MAVRAPSPAGWLPQLEWVYRGEVGWLLGRHRQQAGSHFWNGCIGERLGGCPGVFREQARSYRENSLQSLILILLLLWLLTLIHPPLRKAEWRCSSGDWRAAPFDAVELIACRCQRSQPEGDAPG